MTAAQSGLPSPLTWGWTVMAELPLRPLAVALIVAEPAATPVTVPPLTDATAASVVDQA